MVEGWWWERVQEMDKAIARQSQNLEDLIIWYS